MEVTEVSKNLLSTHFSDSSRKNRIIKTSQVEVTEDSKSLLRTPSSNSSAGIDIKNRYLIMRRMWVWKWWRLTAIFKHSTYLFSIMMPNFWRLGAFSIQNCSRLSGSQQDLPIWFCIPPSFCPNYPNICQNIFFSTSVFVQTEVSTFLFVSDPQNSEVAYAPGNPNAVIWNKYRGRGICSQPPILFNLYHSFTLCSSGVWIGILVTRILWQMCPIKQKLNTTAAF